MVFVFSPGAVKSPASPRDWHFPLKTAPELQELPEEGGLEDFPFEIQDQQDMPICTGMSGAYLQSMHQSKEKNESRVMSGLALYRLNKRIDGLDPLAAGSTNKATVENLRLFGVCRELLFPTNKHMYDSGASPHDNAGLMADAYANRIAAYTKCDSFTELLQSLAGKRPVIFALFLTKDFWLKAKNGHVSREVTGELAGGHSMLALRFNARERWVKVVQSWGRQPFTDEGYMYIPFEWFEHVQSDWGNFPFLMDAYACWDYAPPPELVIPKTLTVGTIRPQLFLNGMKVQDERVIAIIAEELGRTLVSIRTLEVIGEMLAAIIGKKVEVSFDAATYEVRINI